MKKVEIIPYQSQWPLIFLRESENIKKLLGNNVVAIHHVGSTAVPGLDSKDKIDICLQIKDAKSAIINLEKIGFKYSGEWNIPFKYGLTYRHNMKMNLHMFDFAHPAIESNLLFRDYLRNTPSACEEYTELKYKILQDSSCHEKDNPFLYNYTLRKSSFIKSILQQVNFDKIYMQYCIDDYELQTARILRKKYFVQTNNIKDQYACTFDDKNHKHIVLYEGVDIVAYAHIQLQQGYSANIHILIVDEQYKNKDYGTKFMNLIEKWFRFNGIKNVNTNNLFKNTSFR